MTDPSASDRAKIAQKSLGGIYIPLVGYICRRYRLERFRAIFDWGLYYRVIDLAFGWVLVRPKQ
jgi:hypothetical protein